MANRSAPPNGRALCSCPLSLISVVFQNGPERSRARRFCAAKRTLDGEDRSGRWRRRERGRGRRGIPRGVWGGAPFQQNPASIKTRGFPQKPRSITNSCSEPFFEDDEETTLEPAFHLMKAHVAVWMRQFS